MPELKICQVADCRIMCKLINILHIIRCWHSWNVLILVDINILIGWKAVSLIVRLESFSVVISFCFSRSSVVLWLIVPNKISVSFLEKIKSRYRYLVFRSAAETAKT